MNNERNIAILSAIRKMARELPGGYARAIANRCDKVQLLMIKGREFKEMPAPPKSQIVDESMLLEDQRMTIYNYLLAGNTITSLQAIKLFGITRLSARIMDIEKMTGKAPNRRRIVVTNRNGRNVSVCEYWIDSEE